MKKVSFLWLSPPLSAFGRKFGIDAHYFAKNSALVLLGHGVSIIRGIIAGYFVARFFNKDIYGEYQFILSVVGMLSLFGLAGMSNAVTRAWARGDAFSQRKITMHHLGVCLIGSLILFACIPFLQYYNRQDLWPLFAVAGALFPLSPLAMARFGGFTIGKARFDIALKVSIVWSVLLIIATLAILFLHQSALLMFAAATAIPSLVYLYYSRGVHPPAAKNGEDNTNAIIAYAWRITFATLPLDLVWYLDKLLVSQLFGLNQLATFTVALLIPEQVRLFAKQFLPVSFAKQARGADSWERRKKLTRIVLFGTFIFAIGVAAYIILSPWLMPLLFPQYDAHELSVLTGIASLALLTMPGMLYSQYLEAQGMLREIRIANWGAAVIFGLFLAILIPSYGLLGAVIARALFRFTHLGFIGWFIFTTPLMEPVSMPRS
jgi:O-antigen/teichoic acid export membrane protein